MMAESDLNDLDTPRHQRIALELAQNILDGQLATGEKLPSHRALAHKLRVTTGTISRAYSELERRGLAVSRVGDGTYVSNARLGADDAAGEALAAPIDLAHNVPVPTEEVSSLIQVLTELVREPQVLAQLLSYQPEAGAKQHRMAGAQWLKRFGTSGAWNRVMVSHGAQHALAGVLRTIARPGDTLLVEGLSYPGIFALARSLRLHVIGLEMDDEGLLPDALDKAAATFQAKMLFCSPTLHNPTTSTMSMARREAIAAVVKRRSLLLMEDVVHAAVLADPPPALSTLVPEQSFLMSSMSKVMAPGLRVGFLEASPVWLDKVAANIRADCWMVAPLMPEIASRWLQSGLAEHHIALQRQAVDERMELAMQCLAGQDFRWSEHHPHLWLTLPALWQPAHFAQALRRAGVLVRTADYFVAGRAKVPNAVRISLNTAASNAQLLTGLLTIASVLQSGPDVPERVARLAGQVI